MTSAQEHGNIPAWTLADRLRKAREVAGLDQNELAQVLEISRNSVGNAESGKVHPRKITLSQWALRTGVPLEWLLSGKEGSQPDDGLSNATGRSLLASVRFLRAG